MQPPARRTRAFWKDKFVAIKTLTQKGMTARATKAVMIAERWVNTPTAPTNQLALGECSRNGGLAAAVILQLYEQHGSVMALKYTKKIAQFCRTNHADQAEV
jgi:hypothetical protein